MAYRKIFLALAIAVCGGGVTFALASDDASAATDAAGSTKGVQTSLRGGTAGKTKASGDEATAPRKDGAAKAKGARQTKALGESTDFVDNGPQK